MCNVETKLLAWLDGELPGEETSVIEAHVHECQACRARVAAYKKVSEDFNLYCDAVFAAKTKSKAPHWVPALAMAAAAILIFSFVVFSRRHGAPSPLPEVTPVMASAPSPASTPVRASLPAPHKWAGRKPERAPAPRPLQQWQPAESAVEIAIPADSIFAPGAMPEGMRFIGELRIAADGSVRQVRFRQ
jgi:anti-sigma factor RsiW